MCLTLTKNSEKETKKLIEHRKKVSKKNYIIAYKAYDIYDGKLEAPYQHTNYKIGENVSNRTSVALSELEIKQQEIFYGFHVYLEKKYLVGSYNEDYIPVKIYLDDIVVIGKFAGDTSLVCTKMTISEKDYNNAIKKDKLCV